MVRIAILYDYYGPLLTEKQRRVLEMHYQDDMSLAEIAEIEKTSRQAVHDILRRAEETLREFEEKLGLARQGEGGEERMAAAAVSLTQALAALERAGLTGSEAAALVKAAFAALKQEAGAWHVTVVGPGGSAGAGEPGGTGEPPDGGKDDDNGKDDDGRKRGGRS